MANRTGIYYWKCDRPDAFFAIRGQADSLQLDKGVHDLVSAFFGEDVPVRKACGQGNHLTFLADHGGHAYFIRVENGSDGDDYMEVEASVLKSVKTVGIPVPEIFAVDSSRSGWPFAYQIMENMPYEDLNRLWRAGTLDLPCIMYKLGEYVARWQELEYDGFGPFNAEKLRGDGVLEGLHKTYQEYYFLNMSKHLEYLDKKSFLTNQQCAHIMELAEEYSYLLELGRGCLVHKDLALWNVLGDKNDIKAVIDWDDSICGDPVDDLSLMGCYHSGREMTSLLKGYESVRHLPENFEKRFWLHLLRNMIFKAVIRVGAGYFDRCGDFFLSDDGSRLKATTLSRINSAVAGLEGKMKITDL